MHGYDANDYSNANQRTHQESFSDVLSHHPDSTDSYVTYHDSDDSMHPSP